MDTLFIDDGSVGVMFPTSSVDFSLTCLPKGSQQR